MNEFSWDFKDLRDQEHQSTEEDNRQDVGRRPELQLLLVSESDTRQYDAAFIAQWNADRLSSGL